MHIWMHIGAQQENERKEENTKAAAAVKLKYVA
jgi:hypothetical protein